MHAVNIAATIFIKEVREMEGFQNIQNFLKQFGFNAELPGFDMAAQMLLVLSASLERDEG